VLKAVKRKGWAANRAKIPLMDLLCWHIAYKRRKNDSNKASCNIWVNITSTYLHKSAYFLLSGA